MSFRINIITVVSLIAFVMVLVVALGLHVECEMFGSGCKHSSCQELRTILSQFELLKLGAVLEMLPLISVCDRTCNSDVTYPRGGMPGGLSGSKY